MNKPLKQSKTLLSLQIWEMVRKQFRHEIEEFLWLWLLDSLESKILTRLDSELYDHVRSGYE